MTYYTSTERARMAAALARSDAAARRAIIRARLAAAACAAAIACGGLVALYAATEPAPRPDTYRVLNRGAVVATGTTLEDCLAIMDATASDTCERE